jgi:hypothetical protein
VLKKAVYFFIVAFVCLHVHAQTPLAYYPMDNDAKDVSGNGNNGVMRGNLKPVRDRFNNPCGALFFDGKTGFIEVPSSGSLEALNKKFTFTVWYKFSEQRDNQWLTILCKGKGATEQPNNPQYRFQVQQNATGISTKCNNVLGAPAQGFSTLSINADFTKCDFNFSSHLLETNKWNFYAITYDGVKVVAYMNETKVFEFPYNGSFNKSSSPMYIGLDEPGATEYFAGAMDDLRVFDSYLSESQIVNLFNESRPKTNNDPELGMMPNINAVLPAGSCFANVSFPNPNIVDNCGSITVKQVEGLKSGSAFKKGKHQVTFEVTESTGYVQRSSFYVIVKDVTPPAFDGKPVDETITIDEGQQETVYSYADPIATDCDLAGIKKKSGPSSGTSLKEGTYTVVYEATDNSGNTSTYSWKVTVVKKKLTKKDPVVITKKDTDTVTVVKKDTVTVTKKETVTIVKKDTVTVTKKDTITVTKRDTVTVVKRDTVTVTKKETVTLVKKDTITIKKKDTVTVVKRDTVTITKRETVTVTKNDTVTIVKRDTVTVTKKETVYIKPKEITESTAGRKNVIQKVIEVANTKLQISIFDNGQIDGDTVSVYFNQKVIFRNKRLEGKPFEFEIEIDPDIDNALVMFAENLGSIPPNTGMMYLTDGKTVYKIDFESTYSNNGTIVIRKRQKP